MSNTSYCMPISRFHRFGPDGLKLRPVEPLPQELNDDIPKPNAESDSDDEEDDLLDLIPDDEDEEESAEAGNSAGEVEDEEEEDVFGLGT